MGTPESIRQRKSFWYLGFFIPGVPMTIVFPYLSCIRINQSNKK